jgi:hypothetical protein
MAKRKVGALNFSDECRRLLNEYGMEARETIDELVPKAADTAVKMLKSNSRKRTGAYARDWSKKQVRAWGYGTSYTVYNKKHYRVAHLLENDHPFYNQHGKLATSWKGDGRIAEVEEYTEAWLNDEVYKRFK